MRLYLAPMMIPNAGETIKYCARQFAARFVFQREPREILAAVQEAASPKPGARIRNQGGFRVEIYQDPGRWAAAIAWTMPRW